MLTNIHTYIHSLVVVWLIGFADENQYIIALCLLIEQQKPLLEAEKKGICMDVCMYVCFVRKHDLQVLLYVYTYIHLCLL